MGGGQVLPAGGIGVPGGGDGVRMDKKITEYTDEELAGVAQQGLQGQQALVESNRRLREAANKSAKRILALTVILTVLTAVLTVLTAVQVALFVYGFFD